MYVFVLYDGFFYKMTGVSLEQAKVSTAPSSVDKYVQAAPDSVDVEDSVAVCNMWDGNGYVTKSISGYDLKMVKITACGQCVICVTWTHFHAYP